LITMSKVIADISMSLDGFVTAAGITPEQPIGPGGHRLHDWYMDPDERSLEVIQAGSASTAAIICGRRTYETSVPWWKANGPSGVARVPVIVLTSSEPSEAPENGVYRFVTGGLDAALAEARRAAGDADVCVMGGAQTIHGFLAAGLVDELSLHVVPVLFGDGTRLFATLPDHLQLEVASVVDAPSATHLRYVVRGSGAAGAA
jgi:dihydrofolate reductase